MRQHRENGATSVYIYTATTIYHHHHHSTSYNAYIQYMHHCFRKKTTTTTTTTIMTITAQITWHRGMPLNWGYRQKFNGMPLCKLQVLAALCTPMVAV